VGRSRRAARSLANRHLEDGPAALGDAAGDLYGRVVELCPRDDCVPERGVTVRGSSPFADNQPAVARFRLIDMAGGEIAIVTDARDSISDGETVALADGRRVAVVEVYDDEEHGKDGGVAATLVVDDGSVPEHFR
jgi:hypothetical protein